MMGMEGSKSNPRAEAVRLLSALLGTGEASSLWSEFLCNQNLYWLGPKTLHNEQHHPGLDAN